MMADRTARSVRRHPVAAQPRALRQIIGKSPRAMCHGTARRAGTTVAQRGVLSRMASTATTFVPFSPPNVGTAEIEAVVAVLESGWLTTGPRVRQFEAEFAAYTGAP